MVEKKILLGIFLSYGLLYESIIQFITFFQEIIVGYIKYVGDHFQVFASQMYNSPSPQHTVTRYFTMLNHLRYPVNIGFKINKPFTIKTLRTIRGGTHPGNTYIRVFYEDLIEVSIKDSINNKYKCLTRILFYTGCFTK